MEKVFKDALEAAKEKLEKLVEQRREIDQQIEKLRATVMGLSRLDDEISFEELSENLQEPGMTDAIRLVFQDTKEPLTPTEVRDSILLLGFSLAQHRNPLASIHTVLRRLTEGGELKKVTVNNKTAYQSTGKGSLDKRGRDA